MSEKVVGLAIASACVLGLLAAGGRGVWKLGRDLPRARASSEWPAVEGRILESQLRNSVRNHRRHHRLTYEYRVGDELYHGERIAFWNGLFRNESRETHARYPEGARVTVYYDREAPTEAVLEPGLPLASAVGATAVGGLFAALGIAGAVALVHKLRD